MNGYSHKMSAAILYSWPALITQTKPPPMKRGIHSLMTLNCKGCRLLVVVRSGPIFCMAATIQKKKLK